jgi:hypothetical protein
MNKRQLISPPPKLMDILNSDEYTDVISWIPNGAAFIIYKKKKFSTDVLPRFFKQSKFTSFTRKLNRWGFIRITRGPQTGSYLHKLFHRDHPELCLQMRCQNVRLPNQELTTTVATTTTTAPSIARALLSRTESQDIDLSLRHPTLSMTQGSLQHFNSLPFNSGLHNGHLSSPLVGMGLSSSLTGMNNTSSLLSNPIALMQVKLQLQQLQQQQQQKRLQLQQQQQQVHNEMLRRAMASQASANATRAQLMMGGNLNLMMPPPPSMPIPSTKEGLKFLEFLGLEKSKASSMSAQPLIQAMQSSLFQGNPSGMIKNEKLSSSSSSAATVSNSLFSAPPKLTIDPDQAVRRASAA